MIRARRCASLFVEQLEGRVFLSGDGLLAQYFDNSNFSKAAATRVDARIDFGWGTSAPISGMGVDTFSVRWTGQVEAKYSETYTFRTSSDDGVRLWVDGKLIINNWSDHTATTNTGTMALQAGKRYDLRLDYYDNTGAATARLSWSSASQPLQIIPQASLYSAPATPVVDLTGNAADRMVRADGLLAPVGNTNYRVGRSGQSQASVMVFQLPQIPAGKTLAGAELQLYYESKNGSPTFNVDLYGLGARSTATVKSTDFFAGNYAGDATDATPIQDNLVTPALAAKRSILASNAALTAYVTGAYQSAGAGSYVFLRLSPDSTLATSDRYYVFASGDVWPIHVKPQLRLILAEAAPVVPAPSAPTAVAGTPMSDKQVYLTWTDTSANEDGFRIERSSDGVNFTVIAETPANTQSYTDAAGLLASTSYSYRVSSFNAGGATPAPVIAVTTLGNLDHTQVVSLVSQYGITWTFAQPARVGQYVTGDWWVLGPVTITSISPAATAGRHGSVVNPVGGDKQAYDDRMSGYDATPRVKLPLVLRPGDSLVSSASVDTVGVKTPDTVPGQYLRGPLRTATVLTGVGEIPAANAFRPAYVGTWKEDFTTTDLRLDYLPELVSAGTLPNAASLTRVLDRIWLDHQRQWVNRMMHPLENMPDYGREITNITSSAAVALLVKSFRDQNPALLYSYIQLGIDYYGTTQSHADLWVGNGGHNSGRRMPILFAGVVLNHPGMQQVKATFSENQQTYYGPGYNGQTALFTIAIGAANAKHEEVNPALWDTYGSGSNNGTKAESYRRLNGPTWVGSALATRLLGAQEHWNHPAFFDYVDRWMIEENSTDAFVKAMWTTYRGQADAIGQTMRVKRAAG